MSISNPNLMDGFDINQTNTSEPDEYQQTNGYSTNEVPLASNHGFMFNQWYTNFHFIKKNGFYQWSADVSYNKNSYVAEDGKLYRSLIDTNSENQPSTDDGTNWKEPFLTTDNTDKVITGDVTIGLSDTPSSISYSGTTVTVTYSAGHGRKDGDTLTISGIESTVSADEDYVNGDFTITYVSDTVFTYEATTAPTGTLDYDSATFLSGDLDVKRNVTSSGQFIGKNACTAWVSFDGTTTPPTINDSFNVSDVGRATTGNFTIYFEDDMDNLDYAVTGSLRGYSTLSGTGGIVGSENAPSLSYTEISSYLRNSDSRVNPQEISIHIFGGKD